MRANNRILCLVPALLIAASCAKANEAGPDGGGGGGGGDSGAGADASCGTMCDADHDGVFDGSDHCPNTPASTPVNHAGCSDAQAMWMLEPTFPPFNLTWVPSGDLGKAGGLTWIYTAIERKDLFHIDWLVCDDPATPCGLSLDGPIDVAAEDWTYSAADSDLTGGKLVFTNATHILLDDTSTPALSGRLTVMITDTSDVPLHAAEIATLGMTPRLGKSGVEVTGTSFKVVALAEVKDTTTAVWTPYVDYYNAAPTPMAGGTAVVSYGGSFYDK